MNGIPASGRWSQGFNDPTVFGWLVTGGYFTVSILCVVAALKSRHGRVFCLSWFLLGVVLVLLCLNKQLDMQTLISDGFNGMEAKLGWPGDRRMVIGYSLAGASAIIVVMGLGVFRRLPRREGNLRWAFVCLAGLLVGLMLQYLPFGIVSGVLGFTLFGSRAEIWQFDLMELFELVFLALTGFRALSAVRSPEPGELE